MFERWPPSQKINGHDRSHLDPFFICFLQDLKEFEEKKKKDNQVDAKPVKFMQPRAKVRAQPEQKHVEVKVEQKEEHQTTNAYALPAGQAYVTQAHQQLAHDQLQAQQLAYQQEIAKQAYQQQAMQQAYQQQQALYEHHAQQHAYNLQQQQAYQQQAQQQALYEQQVQQQQAQQHAYNQQAQQQACQQQYTQQQAAAGGQSYIDPATGQVYEPVEVSTYTQAVEKHCKNAEAVLRDLREQNDLLRQQLQQQADSGSSGSSGFNDPRSYGVDQVPDFWMHGDAAWFTLSKRQRWTLLHGCQKKPSHKWRNW